MGVRAEREGKAGGRRSLKGKAKCGDGSEAKWKRHLKTVKEMRKRKKKRKKRKWRRSQVGQD